MSRFLNVVAVLVAVGVMTGAGCSRPPAPAFDSDEDHFLFGSIGAEERTGVPYWIWLVLPRIFPEHLPAPSQTSGAVQMSVSSQAVAAAFAV